MTKGAGNRVMFVPEDDPGYRAHRNRAIARNREATRAYAAENGTAAGENVAVGIAGVAAPPALAHSAIGRRVERAVRLWLAMQVRLDNRRILTWRETVRFGGLRRRYRELDGVWRSDYDAVNLYEIKYTSLGRMRDLTGADQLESAAVRAADVLGIRTVRARLVYVGDAVDRLLVDAANVAAGDEQSPFGVVWVTREQVEEAALRLGEPLPEYWYDKRQPLSDMLTAEAALP